MLHTYFEIIHVLSVVKNFAGAMYVDWISFYDVGNANP